VYRCFDELDDAVVILNRNNTVARLNRSFQDLFGIDGRKARGMEAGDFIARHLAPLIREERFAGRLLEALRHRREVSHAACRLQTPSGETRWFSFSCRVMTGEPYAGMLLARFRDITPERDEALRVASGAQPPVSAESLYTGIGEMIPYGIFLCRPDGTVIHISASFLELAGTTREDCRHAGWLECIRLEDAAEALADWKRCLETGCRWDRELRILGSDRGYHTILSRGAPLRDKDGRIVLWTGINLDITARKHAEHLTAVRTAQQAAIATLGQYALGGAQLPELMDATVRAVAEHLGVEYAKVLRYLPDEDAFLLEAAVGFKESDVDRRRVEGGTDSQAGYTLLSGEPVIVWDFSTEQRFRGPPLLRDEGIISGISVIIQGDKAPYGVLGAHTRMRRSFTRDDINFVQAAANVLAQGIERKLAEEAVMKSEEKFREIAQRSFDLIYTCHRGRGITYISPAVARILGYTPDDLIGTRCRSLVHPASIPVWEEACRKVGRGASAEGLEVRLLCRDGTVAFVELNGSPIIEHGVVVGIQAIGRDITGRKHDEELRNRAFGQIERNIEQFAVLGDHIRQPLQVILARAELLDDREAIKAFHEQVERINEYIRQLDRGWVESRKIREFLRRHELE